VQQLWQQEARATGIGAEGQAEMIIKFEIFMDGFTDVAVRSSEAVRVGRLPNSQLHIDHPSVSRLHAVVEQKGDVVKVIDLGGPGGVRYEGLKIANTVVKSGDEVMFGDVRVRMTFPFDPVEVVEVEYIPPTRG
jgi:pSer/pThr/pTyr-binding forkhead associated (FHA) protein